MKKLLVLTTAAFLFTGISFAQQAEGKKCGKNSKDCCSKDCSKKATDKKEVKAAVKASTSSKKA